MARAGKGSSCLGFLVSSGHEPVVTSVFTLSVHLMGPWGFSVFRNPLFETPVVAYSLPLKPPLGRASWQLS